MSPLDLTAAASFWTVSGLTGEYTVERFGDSAQLADALLALVIDGRKRATASLVRQFGDEPLPRIGVHWVVCDGSGQPRVVLRTVELRLGPFSSVTESFAYAEGENDRTRDGWLDAHRAYFGRVCQAAGVAFDEDTEEVLFERFAVMYPPELAAAPLS
ncbi:ASCH domain-containing protein [Actinoplanes sp. NPDC023936]|uniref:ASCH domain-containing protein n=1 Tax=Actinoplanes sp. NPDC023936 TaxID=3154910 RepID=UPI0033C2EF53